MTMNTDDFMRRLARGVEPVAPLPRAWVRAVMWLVGAGVYLSALIAITTSHADMTAKGTGSGLLSSHVAALIVSVATAGAAFASVVPGASGRMLGWAAAAVAAWFGILLAGSLHEWQTGGPVSVAVAEEWRCVAMIALGSAFPALWMILMLRRGAPLTPRVTTALAVLATAALANVSVCVSRLHSSSTVVLVWHGATLLVLVAASAWAGRSLLSWNRIP
jgi:hypothetical protein